MKGRFFHAIQREVGKKTADFGLNRREEDVLSRLKLGHSMLNSSLKLIGKHQTGECEHCGVPESVEHVLIQCNRYNRHRQLLVARASENNIPFRVTSILQADTIVVIKAVLKFLKDSGIFGRI